MKKSTENHFAALFDRHRVLIENKGAIASAFEQLCEIYRNGGKLLVCGNGGSAADADHIVGELMKGFLQKREIDAETAERIDQLDPSEKIASKLQLALSAINLSAHASLTTAISNDTSADMIFAQQVLGYGRKGDILLGISTSGNSTNVVNAGIVAKALGLKTIGLTGLNGGRMNGLFDIVIKVPETATAAIQELHLPVYHTLCAMLEEEFFGEGGNE